VEEPGVIMQNIQPIAIRADGLGIKGRLQKLTY